MFRIESAAETVLRKVPRLSGRKRKKLSTWHIPNILELGEEGRRVSHGKREIWGSNWLYETLSQKVGWGKKEGRKRGERKEDRSICMAYAV